MIFEWDERKRRANLAKHGIDFADCRAVFSGPMATIVDDRCAYGEHRFVTLGLLDGRVVVVAHTETADLIRVISMRWAGKHEQALFFERIEGFKVDEDFPDFQN